ncbi:hypothetical protein, partial [Mesonia sp. HuA40]|uniref:hypothetical protein n=1 Tax=Mesonia sp. HuA40 TaxID=2602761 RepID=UPI001C9BF553
QNLHHNNTSIILCSNFHFLYGVFLSLRSSDTGENETKESTLFLRYFSDKLKTTCILLNWLQGFTNF